MRYASAAAFRQALETRLVALSRDGGLSLVRLRKSVAFDRLLARLFAVAPDRWVLKGGLALDYRLGAKARTTMDVDLARAGDEDAATVDLLATGELDLGDHFSFAIERIAQLDQLVERSAVRYHVRADLAGRQFEEFLLDVGFDFPTGWEPETLHGPDLLAFADIAPVDAPSLPLELHVSEKVHAYTRGYGQSGTASTRVKDLVDLALIASASSVTADRLSRALRETFGQRGHHELPGALPRPPADWRVPYARLATEVGLAAELVRGYELAARLLDPVLSGDLGPAAWEPAAHGWLARSSWDSDFNERP
ncbi:MAG: nucleotidyl transferase AbiEii/AbiGii toxin family protein [Alphaproteobacteria bacterium]|nr:nucleotidyl transferase AbiEii/AbiGii toxin family protein [Alphaproteobacteria bacterium]